MSEAAPLAAPRAPVGHRERVAAALDLAALSPALRVLLTTDGTVTETLAALSGEEVGVRVLDQGFSTLEAADADLGAPRGTRVMARTIVLVGKDSGRTYAAARSRIVPDLLPPGLKDGLLARREPIGQLMLAQRLETFREITACGRALAGGAPLLGAACARALGAAPEDAVLWRTYRVISGGRPVMAITEYFPGDAPEPGGGTGREAPA